MIDDFPGKKTTKAEKSYMSCGYIALQTTETAADGKARAVSLLPLQWISPHNISEK